MAGRRPLGAESGVSDDGWIVIPNWPQFQHYKDRDPLWLKEYISQLHDDRLRKLSLALRGLLFSLHLLYAASDGRVQKNALAITHELGCRVTDEQIDALNHAGFITIAASRPLALSRARA